MTPYREYATPLERDLSAENERLRLLCFEHLHRTWEQESLRTRAEPHAWTWRLVACVSVAFWTAMVVMREVGL